MSNWQYNDNKKQFCSYKQLNEIKRVQILFPCREFDYTKMINTFYLMPNLEEIKLVGEMENEQGKALIEVLKRDELPSLVTIDLKEEKKLDGSIITEIDGLKGSKKCPKLNTVNHN